MGKITKFLKLFIPGINDRGKIISECIDPGFEKIDQEFEKINLKQEQFQINIDGKEDKFIKNDAFNKEFGVEQNKVLEGHRMAQVLGVEKFGGDVQIPGKKIKGYAYWCTANKEMFLCIANCDRNYIDSTCFTAFSNEALLGKLQNLGKFNEVIGNWNVSHLFNNYYLIKGVFSASSSGTTVNFPFLINGDLSLLSHSAYNTNSVVNINGYEDRFLVLDCIDATSPMCLVWGLVYKK